MPDVLLVNCGPSTALDVNAVVRVTFTERISLMLDSGFAGKFANVYAKLAASSDFLPLTPNASVQGNVVAVEDLRLRQSSDVATALGALDGYCGWFVRVSRCELLSDEDAANSQSPDGAAARNGVATDGETQAANDSTLGKIADGLGLAVGTLKWIAIAVVVIGVLVLAARAKEVAGTARKALAEK